MADHAKKGRTGAGGSQRTGNADPEGEIATMTVDELRGWLKDHGVTGTSSMLKDDLVKAAVKTMRSDQSASTPIATGKKSTTAKKPATATSSAKKAQRTTSIEHLPKAATAHEDVIDMLLSQHEEIKMLFQRVESARGEHRETMFQQLVRLLAIHETIEQQLVHPLSARRLPDGEPLVQSRLAEEEQAVQDLSELFDLGVDHPQFGPKLAELRDSVIEHAELEESEEFDYLRDTVPAEELIRLVTVARAAEKVAPTRPHAKMPTSPPANVLLGPPMAIADRIRDAIRDAKK